MPQKNDLDLLVAAPTQLLKNYGKLLDGCMTQVVTVKYVDEIREAVLAEMVKELQAFAKEGKALQSSVGAYLGAVCIRASEAVCEGLLAGTIGEGMPPGVANDIADLYLLLKGSHRLVVKYDALLCKIANKRIESNSKLSGYKDDVLQDVRMDLMKKLAGGKFSDFRGESRFQSYFYKAADFATLNAMRRHTQSTGRTEPLEYSVGDEVVYAHEQSVDERERLTFFDLAGHHLHLLDAFVCALVQPKRGRFEFCGKGVYGIPFAVPDDVRRHYPRCGGDLFLDIMLAFGNASGLSRDETFGLLHQFVTQLESFAGRPDALKRWFNRTKVKSWQAIFEGKNELLSDRSKEMDAYFELLIHRRYKK